MEKLFVDDFSKFDYFLTELDIKKIKRNEFLMSLIPLLAIPYMAMIDDFNYLALVPVSMLVFFRLPYIYLLLVHNQNCNNIRDAVPLWINQIYALIESDTIHNAIVNSYGDDTPGVLKSDLKKFIARIEERPDDRCAYLDFLSRYHIDGFEEIMLKLFEFRELSKERLKHEILSLNKNLNKIKEMKWESRFKNETLMVDILTCFYIFIPSMYFTVVSMMPAVMV